MMDLKANRVIYIQLVQIQKFLREEKPAIQHFYDVWHVAKGIGKKIDVMAKDKNCTELAPWRKSIVNHLHWPCSTTKSGE
ncbi:hypothetical protein SKAU_G00280620 [Synaphobranchus kaupii]|uniref:Uncharacterized protein n=1 Tax=Synaphobranchus kaupii TaxID=118154 RepID=A0A9Q1INN5_SYNKA|nr:hypothetical protein SKAU_G00280620 [Synaphobranchus kaupii]